jgi:hypothetical protein
MFETFENEAGAGIGQRRAFFKGLMLPASDSLAFLCLLFCIITFEKFINVIKTSYYVTL